MVAVGVALTAGIRGGGNENGSNWPPHLAQARGADQLFASAMTTLNTHDPPLDVWHSDARFRGRVSTVGTYGDVPERRLTSSLVRPECIILLRRVILQNFREYPHGAVAKKNVARPSESLRIAREMAESTECSMYGHGVGEGEREHTERCAATFRRGRGERRADSPRASGLTTARPIAAGAAIVYTLPIGSLFFRG